MKRSPLLLALLLSASACAFSAAPSKIDGSVEGHKLARELRMVFPAEETKINGVLRIARPGMETRELPVESQVQIRNDTWSSVYAAKPAEVLVVRHSTNGPNVYEWQSTNGPRSLDGATATNSFAGSDFALIDLGLEFYHWPTQILVTRQMRKGRGCDVLESRPAQTNLYSRVLSWIDQESRAQGQPGLIMAEAYGRDGKLLKEFEIKGMKEVAGRWQVREMELRNRQTKGSTRLEFRFDEK